MLSYLVLSGVQSYLYVLVKRFESANMIGDWII